MMVSFDRVSQSEGLPNATAKLKVFYAAQAEFPSIGTANGFSYVEGNAGYFHAFWNSDFEIDRAFVLLASDKLSGDSLRHFTFEEMTQAFGPARDSDLFNDSVFFADGEDGGSATQLSALDRKLVTFLYTQLRSGDDQHKVQQAFIEEQVPQCGYCLNGWVMTSVALLEKSPKPTDAQIREALVGLKCRCGAHVSMLRAIKREPVSAAGEYSEYLGCEYSEYPAVSNRSTRL
jgi:hypothetical protein